MAHFYTSAEQMIGNTPLLRLCATEKKNNINACLLAKLEWFNPGGSSKDRAALYMILEAERRGDLRPGSVIIEPTSGNTGISLAAIGAVRGYRTVIVMPDSMSIERRTLMTAYGAELVLTPGSAGMNGAVKKAQELAAQIPGSFIPDQFGNPANRAAHFETTGPEIWNATDGKIDIFVAGAGTGGTVSGTGAYLKSKNPGIRVVAVEPAASPLLSAGAAGKHGIMGIGANFIPEILDRNVIDQILTVTEADAYEAARSFAVTQGLLVGISAGAALSAAVSLAKLPENTGKTVVALLPDTGERYLSTPLFQK